MHVLKFGLPTLFQRFAILVLFTLGSSSSESMRATALRSLVAKQTWFFADATADFELPSSCAPLITLIATPSRTKQ